MSKGSSARSTSPKTPSRRSGVSIGVSMNLRSLLGRIPSIGLFQASWFPGTIWAARLASLFRRFWRTSAPGPLIFRVGAWLNLQCPAVEALPLSGFTPETVAEGGASSARARDDFREQGVVPVPAVLNGGESPGAPEDEGISKQDLIRFIQNALTSLRYEPGPIDGKLGSRTASAIRAYQRDSSLVPDGLPSAELLRHLRGQLGELGQQSRDPSNDGQPSG